MNRYFILDRSRGLHILEAVSKEQAKDKYWRQCGIQPDYVTPAMTCQHKGYYCNPLPGWAEYSIKGPFHICAVCGIEDAKPEPLPTVKKERLSKADYQRQYYAKNREKLTAQWRACHKRRREQRFIHRQP